MTNNLISLFHRNNNLLVYITRKSNFNIINNSKNETIIKQIKKENITHDTFIADYESEEKIFIPVGMHLSVM